ncbi:MAG: 50S ribosomal protein L24 [Candidatus Rokuibacteriota bacterium]|nr:MAG: 50S ribosomal protein L24 [Candidatus Rokubacteria bacterium]
MIVERVNMIKKHQRPTQNLRQGGIIVREAAFAISNVLLICTGRDRPVRTGIRFLSDDRKVRVCKRCGESIDRG